ncbi:M20/M25/M40 family metallo-hydrolase [bacterium]|nr:MAG: M20/M25/M40 family metallo-hydrolase [bacterium]
MALLIAFLAAAPASLAGQKISEAVNHELAVSLSPETRSLGVKDTVTLPEGSVEFVFRLHEGLDPKAYGAALEQLPESGGPQWAKAYRAVPEKGKNSFTIEYSGVIFHELEPVGKEYARGFNSTPGIISSEGVVLSSSSFWYPVTGEESLSTFTMTVTLPKGWDAVSQGERREGGKGEGGKGEVVWDSRSAQNDIWLISAPFKRYVQKGKGVLAEAYLREPDDALAQKYLDATIQYVTMYEALIGSYPFSKFALVENFWETGFGMPSFTLLGPKIIRFPFILRTSYPHEILHNWWGNSVYADYATGNWSEGLTAYLADHLLREQAGQGHEYRESTLQKYADYVAGEADAPLTSFVSRHGSASEALGYGKALMVFHMLRRELGDDAFRKGLGTFYEENKWQSASWEDLRAAFEKVSQKELGWFFDQWVKETGALSMKLSGTSYSGGKLRGTIEQVQGGKNYIVTVPVQITLEDGSTELKQLRLEGDKLSFEFELPNPPLRVDVDPEFDLFRLLDASETPPALSGVFGYPKVLMVLPSKAEEKLLSAYRKLAENWASSGESEIKVTLDSEIEKLPGDRAVWVLGWENNFFGEFRKAISTYPAVFSDSATDLERSTVERAGHSVVVTGRNPDNPKAPVAFLAADGPEPLDGLTRKLPHYNKYSYLGFEGQEPANIVKGRWPAVGSPLTFYLTPLSERGKLPKTRPLADLPPVFSGERMQKTIEKLSSDEMEGRGAGTKGVSLAAGLLAEELKKEGLAPAFPEGYFQEFRMKGPEGATVTLQNVAAMVPGSNPAYAGQSVVVGAHYDHLGFGWPEAKKGNEGKLHPGADDNASGVAVLLELARYFAKSSPERALVFVLFSGEEAGRAGSLHYLSAPNSFPPEKTIGMVNLDTVGRLGDGKLLALGAGSAREWVHIFNGAAFVTGAKVESVSKDFGSSDQASFIEKGIPAVQLFTGAHPDYHSPADTPEKIDPEGLAAVAAVAKEAVEYLSARETPLTSTLAGASRPSAAPSHPGQPGGSRKVSIGIIPDFSWEGEGVKVSSVAEGSPAQGAGIEAGDVITAVGGEKAADLKGYSELLRKQKPGDTVKLTWKRGESEMSAEVKVQER